MVNIFADEEGTQTYPAGAVIFEVGDPGDVMYAVKEGAVDIILNDNHLEAFSMRWA